MGATPQLGEGQAPVGNWDAAGDMAGGTVVSHPTYLAVASSPKRPQIILISHNL